MCHGQLCKIAELKQQLQSTTSAICSKVHSLCTLQKIGEKRPPTTAVVQEFDEACHSASECGPSKKQSRTDVETTREEKSPAVKVNLIVLVIANHQ